MNGSPETRHEQDKATCICQGDVLNSVFYG